MKRFYLLITLVAIATSTFAQRSMDLEVTLVTPTAGTQIESGKSMELLAIVKNNGPDSLSQNGDSVLWFWTLDGNLIDFPINGNSGTTWLRHSRSLPVGDTMHFRFPGRSFTYTSVTQTRNLCFNALPRANKGGVDTIGDMSLTNNQDCASVTFKYNWPTSVSNTIRLIEAQNAAVVYPNPVLKSTNIAVKMNESANVAVRVMDITGRTVLTRDYGKQAKGEHTLPLNVDGLQFGVYIYQITMGNDVSKGKLTVGH